MDRIAVLSALVRNRSAEVARAMSARQWRTQPLRCGSLLTKAIEPREVDNTSSGGGKALYRAD
jgi:hypothetical protein